MTLEGQRMLPRAASVYLERVSVVSVESDVQRDESTSSAQNITFRGIISSLGVAFEEIARNEESPSQEHSFNGMHEKEFVNQYEYEGQAVSHLKSPTPRFPDGVGDLFTPAQSGGLGNNFEFGSISGLDGRDKNIFLSTSEIVGNYFDFTIIDLHSKAHSKNILIHEKAENRNGGYRSVNLSSVFDRDTLVRDYQLSANRNSNYITLQDQYVSDLKIGSQSDYTQSTAADADPMSQSLRSETKAGNALKGSWLFSQTDHKSLSKFLVEGPRSYGLKWNHQENVDIATTEGQKARIFPQESPFGLIHLSLPDSNVRELTSPNFGGDQIIGDPTTSKSNQGEARNLYAQANLNILSNQSLRMDIDAPKPIVVISIEQNNAAPDVKFMSSSPELIDLMAQKQSYLRVTFKNHDIEGYNFLFQAGGDEMKDRQRRVREDIQSERYHFPCDEQVVVELEAISGIDKRI